MTAQQQMTNNQTPITNVVHGGASSAGIGYWLLVIGHSLFNQLQDTK
jgi:hypothetical protein